MMYSSGNRRTLYSGALLVSALLVLSLAIAACGADSEQASCIEGRSVQCSCADGALGSKTCQDDGAWSECRCDPSSPPGDADTSDTRRDAGDDDSGDDASRDDGGTDEDTSSDDAGEDDFDESRWLTPYPDPPDDAVFAGPGEVGGTLGSLQPGDTLVLENGEYDAIHISDMHGEESAPITIMAENERQAHVVGDGYDAALRISNSSHVEVQGIHFENIDVEADNSEVYGAMAIYVTGSDHITLWRNLARKPNTWGNNTAVKLASGTSNSLVEENEVLEFHRNGIAFHNGKGRTGTHSNVMRRNYINPRDTARNGQRWGPNYGIANYRGADSIIENNILEYTLDNGEERRLLQNTGTGGEIYGNIVINGKHGMANFTNDPTVTDTVVENNLVLDPNNHGAYVHSIDGFTAHNNTFVNPPSSGWLFTDKDSESPSISGLNNLVIGAGDYGYTVSNSERFSSISFEYSSGWNNSDGTWGPGTDSRQNVVDDQKPGFDGVYFRIPDDSPYKGAGKDGADIGANIVYRYEDGQLTDEPLWHPETGEFPHGATVDGVNDLDGHSAFDVHQRLNVSPETLPDDYLQ